MALLNEAPHVSLKRPVILYARRNGVYSRPVRVAAFDLRAEDNGFSRHQMRWIAKLPGDNLYLIYDGYLISDSASPEDAAQYARERKLAELPSSGTNPWWEWVEALGTDDQVVKAAGKPRETDYYTPENTDEAQSVALAGNVMAGATAESFVSRLNHAIIKESDS
jgi:hypothetical protein